MDMAQDGMSKKVSSLLEKKDAAIEDLTSIRKEAEGTNSAMDKRETLVSRKPREYMSQKRTRLASKVKAALKKAGKMLRKAKPRKKRPTMYAIIASTLKFHKDDDMDPADAGSASRS
ncbi:hypothetical protein BDA96_05G192900 [Sorghum bicolor]|uniref:Uncharacterized protein n=2 Tax=Sorghum bicolor TaxID=4558 RepID=A0A921R147_SORBI|nr:hypothetical protein BDA96_05G192900 [Sorghum bicolor]OQU83790.1 hypothetical protein SORBI_3005G176950 [Sorghum bicolor]